MNEKLKSRKFIFAIWAAITFTLFGVLVLINEFNAPWLTTSMPVLPMIVGGYVGVQGMIDKAKKE